jgi:beta-glucosidase
MPQSQNRRDFLKLAAAVAVTGDAGGQTVSPRRAGQRAATSPAGGSDVAFPPGFRWGVATSAYQVEGAVNEDGRGVSIWDTFSHTPGRIRNGDNADVASDHYHRYKEDVALMRDLGVKAYRFSIAWPRVFPSGGGQANPKGLDFYSRLVDELLAAGIEPYATLYHWDLPQALQDKGGWQSRDTARAFGDYAGHVADKLSDRIGHFFTINEFGSFVDMGYRGTETQQGGKTVPVHSAPGLTLSPGELNQVRHNAVLAHGLSVQAIRARARAGTKCGPAENLNTAVPVVETPECIKAAEVATRDLNASYLTVILEGRYPDAYLRAAGRDAPKFTDEELRTIATPVDFIGLNIYLPNAYVLPSNDAPGYRAIPFNASHPKMLSSWHRLGPEALYWAPRHVRSLWNAKAIYISENGCGASDQVSADGAVYDSDRIMFVRNHLGQLRRATAEGIPVMGYFLWSLLDNFEWGDGFATRFGIVYVDFHTQKRIPKLSATYFREAARRNAVV